MEGSFCGPGSRFAKFLKEKRAAATRSGSGNAQGSGETKVHDWFLKVQSL